MCSRSWATELKEAPCRDFPSRIENQISTWLSHEARVGVKWKCTLALEPAVVLGLMGIEVVEDDMDGGVTIDSDNVVHEVEKLDAAAALFVSDSHLSGGNLEGSKQGRSAVTLVIMTMTGECPTSGELQVSLRPLQRLDRRLFVDTDDDGVLRRRDIKPNYIG